MLVLRGLDYLQKTTKCVKVEYTFSSRNSICREESSLLGALAEFPCQLRLRLNNENNNAFQCLY